MLTRTIRLDAHGRVLSCPHCDNEELPRGDYCMICGRHLSRALSDLRGRGKEAGKQHALQGDSNQ